MKLTLTHPLYRRQTPSNELPPQGYIDCGGVIEVTDVVLGKSIDGNSVWYKGDDGMYYWSGGMAKADFVFPGKVFANLTALQQAELAEQAMDYYYDFIAAKVLGFTGLAIGLKKSRNQFQNYYALVIQVAAKSDMSSFPVPDHLPYCGFSIPTDLTQVTQAISSSLGMSISRSNMLSSGSIGFTTSRRNENKLLLVTNFHVACADLMDATPRINSFTTTDSIKEPDVVMPAKGSAGSKIIGRIIEGRLDRFNDISLVEIDGAVAITNNIQSIGHIAGIQTLNKIKDGFRPGTITLQMFGAMSGFTTGVIESFSSTQPIRYLNGKLVHTLKGLIQVTRMSQPGDSGSAVVDMNKKLVGILVAADNSFSYLLPIENILSNFNLNQPS